MFSCSQTGGRRSGRSAAAGEITTVYSTRLGTITLTWSWANLGIILLTDLRLTQASSPTADKKKVDTKNFRVRLHPFLPWKRKGSKRRHFTSIGCGGRCVVELAWDFSLATFSGDRGPEPSAGYFISIAVDGEVAFVAGNHEEEMYRRTIAVIRKNGGKGPELISQMERAKFGEIRGGLSYATKARFEGKEMVISISIDLQEEEMVLEMDGDKILEVDRLRWKFRGSDVVVSRSGGRVQVSWDIHDWFFRQKSGCGRTLAMGQSGDAVFIFRFERCGKGDGEIRKELGAEEVCSEGGHGCSLKEEEFNESNSVSWSTEISSEAAAVEELECYEEEDQRSADDGWFTLLVSGWKC